MTILDDNGVAPTLNMVQKQRKVKGSIKGRAKLTFSVALETFTQGMGLIWANPDGLTPAEALAGLGTDAAEIVNGAEALKVFLNAAKPNTITAPTPSTLTINEDGTVTVGE